MERWLRCCRFGRTSPNPPLPCSSTGGTFPAGPLPASSWLWGSCTRAWPWCLMYLSGMCFPRLVSYLLEGKDVGVGCILGSGLSFPTKLWVALPGFNGEVN